MKEIITNQQTALVKYDWLKSSKIEISNSMKDPVNILVYLDHD